MADVQRQAVYDWEGSWRHWNLRVESPRVVRTWIRWAERRYGVRPVKKIYFPKNNRGHKIDKRTGKRLRLCTAYDPNNHTITIRPRHANTPVGLHEAAHAIHEKLFGALGGEAHGPIWLGIYLYLLIGAKIAPASALLWSAKKAGLKWAPINKIAPDAVHKRYSGLIRRAQSA